MEDLGNGNVRITDDDGNSIIISREQAKLINDGIMVIDGKNLELLNE